MASIKKNLIYQTLYEVIVIMMPLITSPYISRVLGPEQLGIYSYTYSVAYYFMLFALLGIRNYGNRVIASARDDKEQLNREFSNIFALKTVWAIVVLAAYAGYCLFVNKEHRLYAWIQIFWIIGAVFEVNWFFFGMEQFRLTVVRNAMIKIATVLCVFAFVRDRDDLWVYVAIMAVGSYISQSVVWIFLKRFVRFIRPSWKEMRKHIRPLLLLFIPVIAVSIYKFVAKIMLGAMCSEAQVGFFSNAEKAIDIPTNIIVAFGTVMLPRMSNLIAKGDRKTTIRYISTSMELIMCLAVGMSVGMAAVGQRFSDLMWGTEFTACGSLIKILSMCTIFMAFANVLRTQYIIPNHRDMVYVISVCSGAVVNLAVNVLLIPKMQATGAAIGTLCAEMAVCCVQAICLLKVLPIGKYAVQTFVFAAFSVVMYAVIRLIDGFFISNFIALIAEIAVGIGVYGLLCLSYFIITKNEIVLKGLSFLIGRLRKHA